MKGEVMPRKRNHHRPPFKAQVALAALNGDRTVNDLAGHFGVHATLIHDWKKKLIAGAESLFATGPKTDTREAEARQTELYEQIGRLKMELEWLKKKVAAFG
jgi:putative transposase